MNMRFHYMIGLPSEMPMPSLQMALTYSTHARARQREKFDGVALPMFLHDHMRVVEVEMFRGTEVVAWLVRMPWTNSHDLVMVVQPNGFVRTVWANSIMDEHCTLDRSRYFDPKTGGPAA